MIRTKNRKSQSGQSLVEYVALTALVAIVSIGTVKLFGSKVKTRLNQVTKTFDRNIQQGLKAKAESDPDSDEGGEEGLNGPRGFKMPRGFPKGF